MSRNARLESQTKLYHVILRGINKANVFSDKIDKQKLLYILSDKLEDLPSIEIYSYCIMDTHFHLLLKSDFDELILFMKKVNTTYANYYNRKFNRTGHVFENRYKSQCIDNEPYFWGCLRYIHQNPTKAGIVDELNQYPYSSFHEYFNQSNENIHIKALLLTQKRFPDFDDFLTFHHQYCDTTFLDIEEDSFRHHAEIAFHILTDIKDQYGYQSLSDVFHNTKSKHHSVQTIKEKLHVSNRIVNALIEYVLGT